MSFGYVGATPSQVKFNTGVYSLTDYNSQRKTNNFGGVYEHIQTIEVTSAQAYIEFTDIKEDKYDVHRLICDEASMTASNRINCRFSTNGGSSYITSGYTRVVTYRNHLNNDAGDYSNNSEDAIWYSVGTDNSSDTATTGAYINFYNLGNFAEKGATFEHAGHNTNNSSNYMVYGAYQYEETPAVNALRFFAYTGNLDKGKFRLYGLKRGV